MDAAKLAEHPLCRDCEVAGRITPATEVHHVVKGRAFRALQRRTDPLCGAD